MLIKRGNYALKKEALSIFHEITQKSILMIDQ